MLLRAPVAAPAAGSGEDGDQDGADRVQVEGHQRAADELAEHDVQHQGHRNQHQRGDRQGGQDGHNQQDGARQEPGECNQGRRAARPAGDVGGLVQDQVDVRAGDGQGTEDFQQAALPGGGRRRGWQGEGGR